MKSRIVHFWVLCALVLNSHVAMSMNYLTSASQQVVAKGQALKERAQNIKMRTQQLLSSINCMQNKMGCSPLQIKSVRDVLLVIDASLNPLLNLPGSIASKLQKPVRFIKDKIKELQNSLQQVDTRFTPQQKAAFVTTVKKIAIAAAAIVAAMTVAAVVGVVARNVNKTDNELFVEAFVNKEPKDLVKYLDKVSLDVLETIEQAIQEYPDYPDKSSLLTKLRIAIHNRKAFPEVYQETNLPPASTPDDAFVEYVRQKNVAVVQDWIDQNVPTFQGLERAEKIIKDDPRYPQRSDLLINIHAKKYAKDIRAALHGTR